MQRDVLLVVQCGCAAVYNSKLQLLISSQLFVDFCTKLVPQLVYPAAARCAA